MNKALFFFMESVDVSLVPLPLTPALPCVRSAIMGESKNEKQIKADSVQGAAAPKQISTIIQPCSLHRDSITENKASVYVSERV